MSHLMTKPIKWHVCPAKTQISLGIRPVWSESLLSAWRKLGSLATQWGYSKDSDQTGQMTRLIWVFARRTCHFVGFVMRQLKYMFTSQCFCDFHQCWIISSYTIPCKIKLEKTCLNLQWTRPCLISVCMWLIVYCVKTRRPSQIF